MSRVRFYYYKVEASGRTPDVVIGSVHIPHGGEGKEWKVTTLVYERSKAAAERMFRRSHKEYRRFCRQSQVKAREYAGVTVTRTTRAQGIA